MRGRGDIYLVHGSHVYQVCISTLFMVISTAGITSQAWKIVSQIRVLKKLSSCSVLHLYYYLIG